MLRTPSEQCLLWFPSEIAKPVSHLVSFPRPNLCSPALLTDAISNTRFPSTLRLRLSRRAIWRRRLQRVRHKRDAMCCRVCHTRTAPDARRGIDDNLYLSLYCVVFINFSRDSVHELPRYLPVFLAARDLVPECGRGTHRSADVFSSGTKPHLLSVFASRRRTTFWIRIETRCV